MADFVAKPGGKFQIEVKHNFGRANETLLDFLEGLDDKLKRGVIRKMVAAAGATLAREVRKQIKRRDMPYSRGRNAAERKKSRHAGLKPLRLTIKTKAWSRPRRGIIGAVVGPSWPEGAHGHLVEFGHRITGRAVMKWRVNTMKNLLAGKTKGKTIRLGRHRIRRSGERTIAHAFQQEAMDRTRWEVSQSMARAMSQALAKAGNPHIRTK